MASPNSSSFTRRPKPTASLQRQFRFTFLLSMVFSVAIALTLLVGLWWLSGLDAVAAGQSIKIQLAIQVVLIVVLAVLGTVVGFTMRARIRGSVKTVTIALGDMAQGDFTNRARLYFSDEIGSLSGDVNRALEYLVELVGELQQGVQALEAFATKSGANASQIQDHNESVNQVSMQLADTAQKLGEIIGSLNDSGTAVAGDITQVSTISSQNDQLCSEGIESTRSLEQSMNSLTEAVSHIAELMDGIAQISSETNMLALNATIEAARTGEAGRGFQVVANQANDLARQTVETTQVVLQQVEELRGEAATAQEQIVQMSAQLQRLMSTQRAVNQAVTRQENFLQEANSQIEQVGASSVEVASLAHNVIGAVSAAETESAHFVSQMSVLRQAVAALHADISRFQV